MTNKSQPLLPKRFVGWAVNHAKRNYWRVAAWYDLEDLIQDGLMCAYKCQDRYGVPGIEIDNPHFTSLMKSIFNNHITELVRRKLAVNDRTHFTDLARKEGMTENDVLERFSSKETPLQNFMLLIAELPEHLRKVVELHLLDPDKINKVMRAKWDGIETMSERLYKLCGFPMHLNFETELRAYLWERDQGLVEYNLKETIRIVREYRSNKVKPA